MPLTKINNLCQDVLNICLLHRTSTWSNGWRYDNKGQPGLSNKLSYFYLIYQERDGTFHYQDIDGVDIELEYDSFRNKYRIDIEVGNTDTHNFWLFDAKDWLLVETYIKELITHQYNSIEKLYSLIKLTNDAYFEINPDKMYQAMRVKLRKEKLQKLCQDPDQYQNIKNQKEK